MPPDESPATHARRRPLTDCRLGAPRVRDQRPRSNMRVDLFQRLQDSFNWLGEINQIARSRRFLERHPHVDHPTLQRRLNRPRRTHPDNSPREPRLSQRQRERSSNQPNANDGRGTAAVLCPLASVLFLHAVRSMAAAIAFTCRIISLNCAGFSVCAPSLTARSRSGWTSTSNPSAPAATAARAIGATRSRRPVPCEGSPTIGRCDNFFTTGIAETSIVLRVYVSNVRIPRSHKITS